MFMYCLRNQSFMCMCVCECMERRKLCTESKRAKAKSVCVGVC